MAHPTSPVETPATTHVKAQHYLDVLMNVLRDVSVQVVRSVQFVTSSILLLLLDISCTVWKTNMNL